MITAALDSKMSNKWGEPSLKIHKGINQIDMVPKIDPPYVDFDLTVVENKTDYFHSPTTSITGSSFENISKNSNDYFVESLPDRHQNKLNLYYIKGYVLIIETEWNERIRETEALKCSQHPFLSTSKKPQEQFKRRKKKCNPVKGVHPLASV